MVKGCCRYGKDCNYAHSAEELRPPPKLDKTMICAWVKAGLTCEKGDKCPFAHSRSEMRHTANMYKTNMCRNWVNGRCHNRKSCSHAHGQAELRHYRQLALLAGCRNFQKEEEQTINILKDDSVSTKSGGTDSPVSLADCNLKKERSKESSDSSSELSVSVSRPPVGSSESRKGKNMSGSRNGLQNDTPQRRLDDSASSEDHSPSSEPSPTLRLLSRLRSAALNLECDRSSNTTNSSTKRESNRLSRGGTQPSRGKHQRTTNSAFLSQRRDSSETRARLPVLHALSPAGSDGAAPLSSVFGGVLSSVVWPPEIVPAYRLQDARSANRGNNGERPGSDPATSCSDSVAEIFFSSMGFSPFGDFKFEPQASVSGLDVRERDNEDKEDADGSVTFTAATTDAWSPPHSGLWSPYFPPASAIVTPQTPILSNFITETPEEGASVCTMTDSAVSRVEKTESPNENQQLVQLTTALLALALTPQQASKMQEETVAAESEQRSADIQSTYSLIAQKNSLDNDGRQDVVSRVEEQLTALRPFLPEVRRKTRDLATSDGLSSEEALNWMSNIRQVLDLD